MCRKIKIQLNKKIESLVRFTLRLSGMRMTYEYEAIADEETTTLTRYIFHFGKTPEREPSGTIKLKTSEVIEKLNELNIGGWDGFDGPHPKNVSDGEMFEFVAETKEFCIRAVGSQNFPANYREFKTWLNEHLPW